MKQRPTFATICNNQDKLKHVLCKTEILRKFLLDLLCVQNLQTNPRVNSICIRIRLIIYL